MCIYFYHNKKKIRAGEAWQTLNSSAERGVVASPCKCARKFCWRKGCELTHEGNRSGRHGIERALQPRVRRRGNCTTRGHGVRRQRHKCVVQLLVLTQSDKTLHSVLSRCKVLLETIQNAVASVVV